MTIKLEISYTLHYNLNIQLSLFFILIPLCRYVTKLLGGEAYGSCSVVAPAFRHLDRVMDIIDDDPANVVKFKNVFQRDLAARQTVANETWFKVVTALDPHYKDLKCLPREHWQL